MRESAHDKGRRLLVEGRLHVRAVTERHITATCRGDSGETYLLAVVGQVVQVVIVEGVDLVQAVATLDHPGLADRVPGDALEPVREGRAILRADLKASPRVHALTIVHATDGRMRCGPREGTSGLRNELHPCAVEDSGHRSQRVPSRPISLPSVPRAQTHPRGLVVRTLNTHGLTVDQVEHLVKRDLDPRTGPTEKVLIHLPCLAADRTLHDVGSKHVGSMADHADLRNGALHAS